MGKVLKTVATVASVIALAATGAGAIVGAGTLIAGASLGTIAAAAGATSVVAGSLAGSGRPKIPQSDTQLSRLQARLDTQAPRKMVLGSTSFPIDIRYYEGSGSNEEYVDYILVLAAHRMGALNEVWFDDQLAWTVSGGMQAPYAAYTAAFAVVYEGNAGNTQAINGGARWGSDDRLTGCAYVHIRVKRTGNSDSDQSPYANGLPTRITAIGVGMPMYDPRFDSTRGGSGSMRVDDQNTWGPSSGNTIIQSLNALLGWRINGKLSVGAGIPPKYINFDSVITAANACDEDIVLSGGGTQPRYRTAGAFSTDDAPMNIVGALLAGCAGDLLDSDGQLSFLIKTNTLAIPAVTFDDHDILSPGRWDPMGGQTNLPNIISGNFTDPSNRSLYQPVPYPSVRIDSEDGIERTATVDLAVVENGARGQRLAKQTLQRMQYPGLFSAEYNMKGMAAKVGRIVWQSYSPRGWVNKPFRVVSQKPSRSGRIALVLREEHEDIYAWEAEDSAAVEPAEPVRFDPKNTGPILLAREASKVAEWPRVIDSQGTKPENNATVGAPNGTPVGDRTAEQVTATLDEHSADWIIQNARNIDVDGEIATAQQDITDLFATYGDTASAATSALLAAGYSTDAEAQASIATGQAVIATAQAAAAQQSATLSASVTGRYLNPNPAFAVYPSPSGNPQAWDDWNSNVSPVRTTNPRGGYALRTSGEVSNGGLLYPIAQIGQGWCVLEAEVDLLAGSYVGSGITLAGIYNIDFASSADSKGDISASKTGIRSFSRLVNVAFAAPFNFHLMHNWGDLGGPTEKTIKWLFVGIRPASEAEILAGSAIPGLQASVAINQAAIANAENTAAFLQVLVEASGSNPAIVQLLAGRNGSAIDLVSDVLRIRNKLNGQLVDVATFEGGIARLNAALIRALAVAPTPLSQIFHKVMLEPLRFAGQHGQTIQYQGGAAYESPPTITRDTTGEVLPALPAGEAYDIRPVNITNSSFGVRAVKLVAGGAATQTSAAGANVGGTPQWRTNKPTSANASSGDYTFSGTVTLSKLGETQIVYTDEGNPSTWRYTSSYGGQVQLYGLIGSTWTLLATRNLSRSYTTVGSQAGHDATRSFVFNETVNSNADFGSGSNRFGVHPGVLPATTITAFAGVTYNTQTTSSEVALGGNFKFVVSPQTE